MPGRTCVLGQRVGGARVAVGGCQRLNGENPNRIIFAVNKKKDWRQRMLHDGLIAEF